MAGLFKLRGIYCLVLGVIFIGSSVSAEMNGRSILESVLAEERNRPPVMMDLDVFQKYAYEKDGPEKDGGRYSVQFRQRGEEFDIIRKYFLPQDDKTWKELLSSRLIWDGKKFLYRKQKVGDKLQAIYATKHKNMEALAWRTQAPYLYGVLDLGTRHYAEVLLESNSLKVRPEQEEIDGALCYVVEGDTPNGRYTVWIDANNGFRYRKATVLNKYDPPLDMGSGQTIVSQTSEISGIVIDSIEGKPVIMKASKIAHNLYNDGRIEDDIFEVKRLNVEWNPDFKAVAAFEMDIPDGTRVLNMDVQATGVKFQWYKGKMITMVEDAALDAIDGAVDQLTSTKPVTNDKEPEASPGGTAPIANIKTDSTVDEQEAPKSILADTSAKENMQSKLSSFFKWALILLGILALVAVSYLMLNLYRKE